MKSNVKEIVLQIALEEYESGHNSAFTREGFNKMLKEDFGIEDPQAFDFYAECRNMGPSGFYLMYKDILDFDPMFIKEYDPYVTSDQEENNNAPLEEVLTEDIMYRVQAIDAEGNKEDPFLDFPDEETAKSFAGSLNAPYDIFRVRESLEEGMSRDSMITELQKLGKNYNFNKYTDAQLYRMYQREANKPIEKSIGDIEQEYKDSRLCPQCRHELTDAGECPVCDLGDEEERGSHQLFHLDESLMDSLPYYTILEEDILTEAPFFKQKTAADTIATATHNDDKHKEKIRTNLPKILIPSLKNKNNRFYIKGATADNSPMSYDDFISKFNPQSVSVLLGGGNDLLNYEFTDNQIKAMRALMNAVVINPDNSLLRRGLEVLKPKTVFYHTSRPDLLTVKNGYRAEDVLPNLVEPQKPTEKEPENTPEEPKNAQEPPKNTPADQNIIKASLQVLARRKNPITKFYTKDDKGAIVQIAGVDITPQNLPNIYIDNGGSITLMDTINKIKEGMKRRKETAIKTAALFGESWDDDMQFEEIEEVEIDEALNKDEYEELMALANEIGLKTAKDLTDFTNREKLPQENPLETLRRYRDSLGDDFEINEDYVDSPVVQEHESLHDEVESNDFIWFN